MAEKYKGKTKKAIKGPFEDICNIFESFPDISIDYGLMEKAANVVVVKAGFNWDDIGAWDSLDRVKPKDDFSNIKQGSLALVDVKNSIIINAAGKDMVVAGIGLEDMVIVATGDAILVCPKDRVQDVKKAVEILKKGDGEKWL